MMVGFDGEYAIKILFPETEPHVAQTGLELTMWREMT